MRHKLLTTSALLAATAVAGVAPGVSAGAAPSAGAAAVREFEGTVVSKSDAKRTFRLRDTERGTVRIRVTRNTRFERIDGFAGLKVGARNIEATVRRSNGRWIAIEVERSGGGGEHGGTATRTRGGRSCARP